MMSEVWAEYNKVEESGKKEGFEIVISKADRLIKKFAPSAMKKQKELNVQKKPLPKEGRASEDEKKRVWDFGPLHEVAAALWVKGNCYESMGDITMAIKSYDEVIKYPHAAVYDESFDGFWSPANDAEARKEYLMK